MFYSIFMIQIFKVIGAPPPPLCASMSATKPKSSHRSQSRDIVILWKPLNWITLGQRQTDSNNQLILISRSASTYTKCERVIWDLSSWKI